MPPRRVVLRPPASWQAALVGLVLASAGCARWGFNEAGSPTDASPADSRWLDARDSNTDAATTDARIDALTADALTADAPTDSSTADTLAGTGKYLLPPKSHLLTHPTSGSAWTYLKSMADEAAATPLDASNPASPWLPNYEVVAPKYLAAALVVASSWGGNKAPYRSAVEQALRHIIGSEQEQSSDKTAAKNALLATCRQLAAWVLAADLIEFDRTQTGSRGGWTTVSFEAWLTALRTKSIGAHGRWISMLQAHEDSPSTWGAHCSASLIAASRYLGDASGVARAATVVRGALGDSSAYPAYPAGSVPAPGQGFQVTQTFDPSWACNYADAVGGWLPINSPDCGPGYDGAVVEGLSSSAGAYPNWDSSGINTSYEILAALHLVAVLLDRAGYPAFGWSQGALKRSMLWLQRQGQLPATDDYAVYRHIPWITNHFYGTTLPTQPAAMGRALGFTDWLFP